MAGLPQTRRVMAMIASQPRSVALRARPEGEGGSMQRTLACLAAVSGVVLLAAVAPAQADPWHHDGWRGRDWHHGDWGRGDRGRWQGGWSGGYAYVAPPPVYYAPPVTYYPAPVYYAPPVVTFSAPGVSIGIAIP
jgi:hypothetical protein